MKLESNLVALKKEEYINNSEKSLNSLEFSLNLLSKKRITMTIWKYV